MKVRRGGGVKIADHVSTSVHASGYRERKGERDAGKAIHGNIWVHLMSLLESMKRRKGEKVSWP